MESVDYREILKEFDVENYIAVYRTSFGFKTSSRIPRRHLTSISEIHFLAFAQYLEDGDGTEFVIDLEDSALGPLNEDDRLVLSQIHKLKESKDIGRRYGLKWRDCFNKF